ncbi:MAG: type II secretion system major pseudopilin GspG [Bacteriovoracaceae bacterium]|jgi:general secretion pathway protein G|nr:type II secretion system major pseudopilin GspG [Bacteriovoracaceae bacterium]
MQTENVQENVTKTIVQTQRGFSLIEILIALTLLGIAGAFVAGKVFDQLYEGEVKSTRIQMNNLDARLKEFRRKCGFYPTTEQGLEALVTKPSGGRECRDYPPNGFIEDSQVPKDPWNNDFIYESDGKTFNIISYGPDGEAGGEGNDVDVYLRGQPKADNAGGEAAPVE